MEIRIVDPSLFISRLDSFMFIIIGTDIERIVKSDRRIYDTTKGAGAYTYEAQSSG